MNTNILLITYDLNKEPDSDDYKGFMAYIKSFDWARLSESCYAVSTSLTPTQVYAALKPFTDANDYLIVISLRTPYSGVNKKEVIDWLAKFLPQ